jgi:hypothetical protein
MLPRTCCRLVAGIKPAFDKSGRIQFDFYGTSPRPSDPKQRGKELSIIVMEEDE